MSPSDELQSMREKMIQHVTQSEERWGEHFRWKQAMENRMADAEETMQDMGKWRAEVRAASLMGSAIGGALMSIIVGIVLWKLTGSR